jgi:hypothetical protein
MLFNNDIQLFFYSNDLNFQKEINVIMYIIEILKKEIRFISFEKNLSKI